MTPEEADLRLQASIAGLSDREPLVSAKRILPIVSVASVSFSSP